MNQYEPALRQRLENNLANSSNLTSFATYDLNIL